MGQADGAPPFLLLGMKQRERERDTHVRVEIELQLPFLLRKESSISNSPVGNLDYRLLGEPVDNCGRLKMTLKDIYILIPGTCRCYLK